MKCLVCNFEGKNAMAVLKHVTVSHVPKELVNPEVLISKKTITVEVFSCLACSYETSEEETLRQHILENHQKQTETGFQEKTPKRPFSKVELTNLNETFTSTPEEKKSKILQDESLVNNTQTQDYMSDAPLSISTSESSYKSESSENETRLLTKDQSRFTCWGCWKDFGHVDLYQVHISGTNCENLKKVKKTLEQLKHEEPERRARLPRRKTDDFDKIIFQKSLIKVCRWCKEEFPGKKSLTEHQNSVHIQKIKQESFLCDKCDFQTTKKSLMQYHIKNKHKNLECEGCSRSFCNTIGLNNHLSENSAEKSDGSSFLLCSAIKKIDNNNIQELSTVNGPSYECVKCNLDWKSLELANKHNKLAHYKILGYTCTLCGLNFEQRRDTVAHLLQQHELTKHKVEADKKSNLKYFCNECSYASALKGGLKSHVNTVHLKRRDFNCITCGVAYSNNKAYLAHVAKFHP